MENKLIARVSVEAPDGRAVFVKIFDDDITVEVVEDTGVPAPQNLHFVAWVTKSPTDVICEVIQVDEENQPIRGDQARVSV